MRKLFIDKIDNHKIIISGEEHKHIAYSLRMKKGDEITVCSQGIDYTAVIVSISKTGNGCRSGGQSEEHFGA